MSIHLAALTAADYPEVRRLWESTSGIGLGHGDSEKFFAPYLKRNPGLSLIARDGNRIVAAVMCGHDARRGYLSHLAVAPSHRKLNLGRRLVDACLHKLWAEGITACNIRVFRDNAEGIAFWGHLGFHDVGVNVMRRELVEPGEGDAPDTVLLQSLDVKDHIDPVPTIDVNDHITLTPFDWEDQAALARHLNSTDWYSQQIPLIPHPYTAEHARAWITKCMLQTLDGDRMRSWAIRRGPELIGGIGLSGIEPGAAPEIGYWLTQDEWGRGTMTEVVTSLAAFAFREYPVEKLHARVFHTNPASARVLEKAGFTLEGTLRRHLVHHDVPRDVHYYGLLKAELSS
jgi:RimJ/RimL family protein N-acetyltransferase/ribosomal protein S18 acetylase RimI-like enzyme